MSHNYDVTNVCPDIMFCSKLLPASLLMMSFEIKFLRQMLNLWILICFMLDSWSNTLGTKLDTPHNICMPLEVAKYVQIITFLSIVTWASEFVIAMTPNPFAGVWCPNCRASVMCTFAYVICMSFASVMHTYACICMQYERMKCKCMLFFRSCDANACISVHVLWICAFPCMRCNVKQMGTLACWVLRIRASRRISCMPDNVVTGQVSYICSLLVNVHFPWYCSLQETHREPGAGKTDKVTERDDDGAVTLTSKQVRWVQGLCTVLWLAPYVLLPCVSHHTLIAILQKELQT